MWKYVTVNYIMVIEVGCKPQWSTNEPETLFRLHLALVSICHACRQTFPATCKCRNNRLSSTQLDSFQLSRANSIDSIYIQEYHRGVLLKTIGLCSIGILLRWFARSSLTWKFCLELHSTSRMCRRWSSSSVKKVWCQKLTDCECFKTRGPNDSL